MFKPIFYIIIFIILSIEDGLASDSVIRFLDSKSEDYAVMSKTIWSLAELGYQEKETSKLMQSHLKQENFSIDYGVAEALTTYGIIGIKVWIYKGELFDKDIEKEKMERVKNVTTNKN